VSGGESNVAERFHTSCEDPSTRGATLGRERENMSKTRQRNAFFIYHIENQKTCVCVVCK
jgi:hypothetical protein